MTLNQVKIAGFIILGIGLVLFGIVALLSSALLGTSVLLTTVIIWLIVVNINGSQGINGLIGVVLIIVGFIFGCILFFTSGLSVSMFGGYEIQPEGVTLALATILLFLLAGFLFIGLANLELDIKRLRRQISTGPWEESR